eukprot:TRINITY_DN11424_c0_g1_i7.p1 TRINITY_DN11424_c0_g1~~TRINITY_DN11424_c0_g1_i7.p1  ORF type:complete len:114 (+),score=14.79 TRINITY_DN11424_c0_g1_i7:181-522(+)
MSRKKIPAESTSSLLSQKRFKPELTVSSQSLPRNSSAPTYVNRNEEYINNGISPYTIQFLRKMAEYNKSTLSHHLGNDYPLSSMFTSVLYLSLIHICRCRRYAVCRSRWSPYN